MSYQRYFVIRLDIDTPQCLQIGVPGLIQIAKEFNVYFTFFANMGRSVSRIETINKLVNKEKKEKQESVDISKLSNLSKLGVYGYLKVALFNHLVGLGSPDVLQTLKDSGHEIGLHGGENHALWQNNASTWSRSQLEKQIDWGVNAFNSVLGYRPTIFSSPGWNSPDGLSDVLLHAGFSGLADTFFVASETISSSNHLQNINTNLVGRPGGVGFFEYCKSVGLSETEVFEKIKLELNAREVNVIYDHPFYLVKNHSAVLRKIIDYALKSNIKVITMGQLLKLYE